MSIQQLLRSPQVVSHGIALLLAYGMLLAAGAAGSVWLFVVAAVAVAVAEIAARRVSGMLSVLARLGTLPTHRHLARDAAVLLLLAQSTVVAASAALTVALLMAVGWVASVGTSAAAVVIRRVLVLPVVTRNIDLSGLDLPAPPHPLAMALAGERSLYIHVALVPVAVMTALTGMVAPLFAAGAASSLAAVGLALWVGSGLLRARRSPSRNAMLEAVRSRVQPAPSVVVYFAGSGEDAYQINMWLDTVAALGVPALVVLRERSCLGALAPTSLPVVCVPGAVDLMNFGFDSVRVALYPSNTAKNIHMLREPGMKHVFVGHGDSDKVASVNPFSKVYDEVWVAGPAGRDRYAAAAVGVRDEDIVEVGRPQLAAITSTGSAPSGPYTVLYAPTWEGWVEDPHATSLLLLGEEIVRALLDAVPPVRVWYRPHPLTGSRSAAVAAAHRRVVAAVRAAGAASGPVEGPLGALGHRVFSSPAPALYACFNHSDLLISDVSSVVSDWLASRKPYAVGNAAGLAEDEFRGRYPTARAAYLLEPRAANLPEILRRCRAGDDPMAIERDRLAHYLHGPDQPSSLDRFRAEVSRLGAARPPRQPAVPQPPVPQPPVPQRSAPHPSAPDQRVPGA